MKHPDFQAHERAAVEESAEMVGRQANALLQAQRTELNRLRAENEDLRRQLDMADSRITDLLREMP